MLVNKLELRTNNEGMNEYIKTHDHALVWNLHLIFYMCCCYRMVHFFWGDVGVFGVVVAVSEVVDVVGADDGAVFSWVFSGCDWVCDSGDGINSGGVILPSSEGVLDFCCVSTCFNVDLSNDLTSARLFLFSSSITKSI